MSTSKMDVSDVLEYANEKGFGLDGFNLKAMFPKKTNWRELEGAQNTVSPTWELLKLQVRRQVLEGLFKSMEVYSRLPHLYIKGALGSLFCSRGVASPMRYRERKCSKEELLALAEGPKVVAIALELDHVKEPSYPVQPKQQVLATGEVLTPSKADLREFEQTLEAMNEAYYAAQHRAGEKLAERAARVCEWASLAPCVETLLIFERTGHLSRIRGQIVGMVDGNIASLPLSQQRPVQCSFPGNTPGAEPGTLQVIFMDEQDCLSTPDLFVSFDGRTNGYPLRCLKDAQVFVPERRQLLCERRIELLDFVQALKAGVPPSASPSA